MYSLRACEAFITYYLLREAVFINFIFTHQHACEELSETNYYSKVFYFKCRQIHVVTTSSLRFSKTFLLSTSSITRSVWLLVLLWRREKMSCGNTKQQLERAGINALAICTAPYKNATNEIANCNCPFSEHRDEAAPGNYSILWILLFSLRLNYLMTLLNNFHKNGIIYLERLHHDAH